MSNLKESDLIGDHGPVDWSNAIPAGCPFEQSQWAAGIEFTGPWARYTNADTWYLTWADDNNCYSPYTDGSVYGDMCVSAPVYEPPKWDPPHTGQAKIVGDNPLDLEIVNLGHMTSALSENPEDPHHSRYPCGSLVHNGIWYHGTYLLTVPFIYNGEEKQTSEYGEIGPFMGFRISSDFDHYTTSWEDGYWHSNIPQNKPLFENIGDKIKIGKPHFVNFGKNLEYSPDGKAYMVACGCEDPESSNSWYEGDSIFLLRVTPSVENMNDKSKWEFFAGHDDNGDAVWTNNFTEIKPLITWKHHLGCVSATYFPQFGKYVMCISYPTIYAKPWKNPSDTLLLESSSITGPWKVLHYLSNFASEIYFANIPSKFISVDGTEAWMCYSANFQQQEETMAGSNYAMCLHKFRIKVDEKNVRNYRYDFGTTTSLLQSTYCRIHEQSIYWDGGYGWLDNTGITAVDYEECEDALKKDLISGTGKRTFRIDLPSGKYDIKLLLYDHRAACGAMDLYVNGTEIIEKLKLNAGEYRYERFTVEIINNYMEFTFDSEEDGRWIINSIYIEECI